MPTLPILLPVLPSGGDLPVRSTADVLAVYPAQVQREPSAPVRDALIEGETEMLLAYQRRAEYAAAQSDPTRATGVYLDDFGAAVGVFRQENEVDEDYRARIFAPPALVTPTAIKAAIDAVLAQITTKRCIVWESVLDQTYVDDGTATWALFLGDDETVDEMTPYYPDRRYALRGQCEPGFAYTFDEDTNGRFFIARIPDLTPADAAEAYIVETTANPLLTHAFFESFFPDDGTGPAIDTSVFDGGLASETAYATIINSVEAIRGHSVRWRLLVDPRL